jgi:DnaJ-domain-containing protein 1
MNAFDVFGLEPIPHLDVHVVKQRFHELSATLHPDIGGKETEAAFTELNQAFQILSSDRLRLKHFLELSGLGDLSAISTVPPHLASLFMSAGDLMHSSKLLIKAKLAADSALELATLQGELLEKSEACQQLLTALISLRNQLREQLSITGQSWVINDSNLARLKNLYLEFSYVEKWIELVQERSFLLSE